MTALELDTGLKELMPFQSQFVEIDGHRMHYLDEGIGPVVILLHGNPTWCFFYRRLISELRDYFRVIAPDFIGCGLSDHPTDAHFRGGERVDHLEKFIGLLGIDSFSLVMHDWGGSIGTSLATRFPEKIERLVFLNTTLTETESLPRIIKMAAKPIIGRYLTQFSTRFLKFTTTLGVGKKLPKKVRRGYYFPYKTKDRRTAIWDFVQDIPFDERHPTYSLMLELARNIPLLSKVPVQIVWGLKDPCFHREMLTKVAEHFPHANVLEIPEAGHLVLEDAPELACATVKSFLLGQEAPSIDKIVDSDGEDSVNPLYSAFSKHVEEHPELPAVIEPSFLGATTKYAQLSYGRLASQIYKYRRGLDKLGLERGDKVLMLVSPGIEFLALSYAVMGQGGIPVFLDSGMGLKKLLECIAEIEPQVFIASPKAKVLPIIKKRLFSKVKFTVLASEWVPLGGYSIGFLKKFAAKEIAPISSPGISMIAYTSGATGTPKGVVFTHKMISAQLKIFSESFGISTGDRDLPLLPIFSLYNLALGVCSVYPPMNPSRPIEMEADKVVQLINDQQVTNSFGSPTLWRKLAEYCIRSRSRLPTVKKIFIAGAPVPIDTLKILSQILPSGAVTTPYGATEALPTTLVYSDEVIANDGQKAVGGEEGMPVGKAVPGIEIKVIKPVDGRIASEDEIEELPSGEIGEVIVKGENVSPQYFRRSQVTWSSKIAAGDQVWHRMGDMGYLSEEQFLYFCGRKAHLVKTETGAIFYSVPVERIFNTHERVFRSALIPYRGGVAVVIEPLPQYWPEAEHAREGFIKELLEIAQGDKITSSINTFFFHRSFPVDGRHNAKIFREQLAEWAEKEEAKKAA